MARKQPKPVHPLAMAEAITTINERAGLLLATIHTVGDLAGNMNIDQLREGLKRIGEAADELRTFMWPEAEDA